MTDRETFVARQAWERAMFIANQKREALAHVASGTEAARLAMLQWDIAVTRALELGIAYGQIKGRRVSP